MYAELQVTSHFSFHTGASHPDELVWRAKELGYTHIAITDRNTLSSAVRAHAAARDADIRCLVGARIEIETQPSDSPAFSSDHLRTSLLIYPYSRTGYGKLCRLLTEGRARVGKNDFLLSLDEFLPYQNYFVTIVIPPYFQTRPHLEHQWRAQQGVPLFELCKTLRDNAKNLSHLSIALIQSYGPLNHRFVRETLALARSIHISVVATNDVHYHAPERKALQDVLTCIRLGCTVQQAGVHLLANAERYLKPPQEMMRLFRDIPTAISRTAEMSEICEQFSLTQVRYDYPEEIYPQGQSAHEYLQDMVYKGAMDRYPEGVPKKVLTQIEEELSLVHELNYEKYFLTCFDIVSYARSQGILCQGRGAAANSVICYCLGITSVDPSKIDLLFARFVSKERKEPPDIDIDFEHERREEVIQYIYRRFGRDRAAIASEVVTYRPRSAIREVGKALGLSLEVVDHLAKSVHRWTGCSITADLLRELGLDPFDATVQNALILASEIVGFPRHLSQHVGGFIISQDPLCEIVPIINAGMEGRTIIEWDKNDIEELGMLKIDILALGMLTCIRKAIELVNQSTPNIGLSFHSIPPEAPEVYEMLQKSDSVGVFQVESRAQMSMLPRLKPKCFYDLVIEVAIVRPGPIQGNMVHPYLRRRNGLERASYPDARAESILSKTLGVPIFQEQAMRLAITLANFTPDEAERLRRAVSAWKSDKGALATFKEKIISGMKANGYSPAFAQTCFSQIQGFSEYGFPESHAASFALLVYASAWLKCFYPAQFYCALLNSQPMGFYSPSQIIRDAQRHQITVLRIDVNCSNWDCSLEHSQNSPHPAIRLGLRLIIGLRRSDGTLITESSRSIEEQPSLSKLHTKAGKRVLLRLANADALSSMMLNRTQAIWFAQALPSSPAPMDPLLSSTSFKKPANYLPHSSLQQDMFNDFLTTGLSLKAHPLQFARKELSLQGVHAAKELERAAGIKVGTTLQVAGIVTVKQRPGTAKGVVFITLEDETGGVNLIIRPLVFEQFQREVLSATALLARGRLERIGDVVYLDANYISSIDSMITVAPTISQQVKNYSY